MQVLLAPVSIKAGNAAIAVLPAPAAVTEPGGSTPT
jgi:hypothetical protein